MLFNVENVMVPVKSSRSHVTTVKVGEPLRKAKPLTSRFLQVFKAETV